MVKKVDRNEKRRERKDTIKWVLAFISILMLGVMVAAIMTQGFTNANPYGWFGDKEIYKEVKAIDSVMVVDIPENQSSNLMLATTASETPFASSITATVIGETDDKTVVWSIKWSVDATRKNEDVNTYISSSSQTTPTGSTLSLNCLKGFEGDTIVVVASSAVADVSAECKITFDGAPTAINVNLNGHTPVRDTAWGGDMFVLETGSAYSFTLSLGNEINSIGSKYGKYEIKFEAVGTFNMAYFRYFNPTSEGSIYEVPLTLEGNAVRMIQDEINPDGTVDGRPIMSETYMTFSSSEKAFSVTPLLSSSIGVEYDAGSDRGGGKGLRIKSYVDDKCPCLKVTIKETVSGLEKSVYIRSVTSVSSVNLSTNSIVF